VGGRRGASSPLPPRPPILLARQCIFCGCFSWALNRARGIHVPLTPLPLPPPPGPATRADVAVRPWGVRRSAPIVPPFPPLPRLPSRRPPFPGRPAEWHPRPGRSPRVDRRMIDCLCGAVLRGCGWFPRIWRLHALHTPTSVNFFWPSALRFRRHRRVSPHLTTIATKNQPLRAPPRYIRYVRWSPPPNKASVPRRPARRPPVTSAPQPGRRGRGLVAAGGGGGLGDGRTWLPARPCVCAWVRPCFPSVTLDPGRP